jgi:hypothetical protein
VGCLRRDESLRLGSETDNDLNNATQKGFWHRKRTGRTVVNPGQNLWRTPNIMSEITDVKVYYVYDLL